MECRYVEIMAPKKLSGAALAGELAALLPQSVATPSDGPRKRGRPPKAHQSLAVTLRLDPHLYNELGRHLPSLTVFGRTMPTVQDLLRAVAVAIVDEPETIRALWEKGRDQ